MPRQGDSVGVRIGRVALERLEAVAIEVRTQCIMILDVECSFACDNQKGVPGF